MKNLNLKKTLSLLIILSTGFIINFSYAQTANDIIKTTGIKGGLIVHINCGDGKLTSGLAIDEKYLVQGLDTDAAAIQKARNYILSKNKYGQVSVSTFNGKKLPYAENLVNLIVSEDPGKISQNEIMRVLAPYGVAYIKKSGKWVKTIKPWPKEISEWNHYLNGPDNNAVAQDSLIGVPRSLQWTGPPKFGRTHEELASISAVVSSKGRIFYISDEAPPINLRLPAEWKLVAQDAFNGVILWKKPISTWVDHLRHFRSGPAHLPRRMVASGDVLYTTLGLDAPLSAIDAATGDIIKTYKGTEYTEEIIYNEGILFLVVGSSEREAYGEGLFTRGHPKPSTFRYVTALDAKTGKTLWKHDNSKEFIVPLTLACKNGSVYFQTTLGVYKLDAKTGKKKWLAKKETPVQRYGWSAPTLVVHDKVVLLADRDMSKLKDTETQGDKNLITWGVHGWNIKEITRKGKTVVNAYSIDKGKELWTVDAGEGYNAPTDVFIINGLVWLGPEFTIGYPVF